MSTCVFTNWMNNCRNCFFRCSLIALGNGTACRKTEVWLTQLINTHFFNPLKIKYTIVSEDGASIYSCSAEAKKEFPKLDTNIISAGNNFNLLITLEYITIIIVDILKKLFYNFFMQ